MKSRRQESEEKNVCEGDTEPYQFRLLYSDI